MNESAQWYTRNPLPPAVREETPTAAENERHRFLREHCSVFLLLAAAVGAAFALCFVDAGWGVNFVVYALLWSVCAHLALKKLGLARLSRDLVWYGGGLLLALTVFWTANPFVQFVSAAGCLLLQCLWALNAIVSIRDWHFGKAAGAVIRLVFRSLGRVLEPFSHLAARRKSRRGSGRGKYILLGLVIAVPLAWITLALLSSGDAVFRSLLERLFLRLEWDDLGTVCRSAGAFFFAGIGFYALLCAQTDRPEPETQPEPRRADTLVAVTFTAVLAGIYLLFCGVQIAVLFRGSAVSLPEGYTYARYAREGFFQLLAVSAINVLLVIVSQRRFVPSAPLRTLLCVISGCTVLMELSSAWRMILYVQVYGLTFLRILVLWFLGVLAVILAGAVITVFRPSFRLFRFSLGVCLAAWLVLAFARPDAMAARYDLRRFGCTDTALSLIRYELSHDAVAELRPYLAENRESIAGYLDDDLLYIVPDTYANAGIRGFNYSRWQANETAKEYVHGK